LGRGGEREQSGSRAVGEREQSGRRAGGDGKESDT